MATGKNGTLQVEPINDSVYAHVSRDAQASDLALDEFGYTSSLESSHIPNGGFGSLQDVFDTLEHEKLLSNSSNFSHQTSIDCLDVTEDSGELRHLDDMSLREFFKAAVPQATKNHDTKLPSSLLDRPSPRRLLLFFVPLTQMPQASFGSRVPMTQSSIVTLFQSLKLNLASLANIIGRPDYWAPQANWNFDETGNFDSCDLFCQHPRWNISVQGAPLSVYMRYDKVRELTTYVISHKQNDSSIKALRNIVNVAKRKQTPSQRAKTFLEDPFSIHVLLSTLSFEASKHHVQRFQQFMWSQFNKVDDHLGGVEASDRAKLGDLTRQLQIISQNADIHDGNCNVALVTASGIRDAHARFHASVGSPPSASQRGTDAIQYVIECMKKQKMWFLNYKSRKDSIMILVYNLVTQQDAANNFQIATDMKRDSTSMNSIAALTMAFLPGTFTAGVLDAGIFSSKDGSSVVQVSRIWWIWVAITVPLTVLVIVCWWIYKTRKAARARTSGSANDAHKSEQRTFSAGSVPVPVRGNGSSGLV